MSDSPACESARTQRCAEPCEPGGGENGSADTVAPSVSARSQRPPKHAGFTLIEVLVAFVILAGSVLALMQLFSGGLNAAQRLDDSAKAATYAESRLAETIAQKELGEGSESGEFENGRFRWTTSVVVVPDPVPPPEGQQPQNMRIKLLEVAVVVEFGFSGEGADARARNVTLRTLRVVPKKVGEA